MGWGVQTFVSRQANGAAISNDIIVQVLEWDQDGLVNTVPGSAWAALNQPLPSARGTLDDETADTVAHGYLAAAPSVGGGRRAQEIVRARQYAAAINIDYQQRNMYDPIWLPQVKVPVAAKGNQELQPVWNQRMANQKKFWATTTQEGLRWMHPSFMPLAVYGDDICRLLSEVQRHLLEPVIDGGVTWQLWTQTEVQQAFLLRLNRFLLETGIIRKESVFSASSGNALLTQDVLEVKRVQWRYNDFRKKPRGLTRIDHRQADSGHPDWDEDVNEAEPYGYMEDPSAESMELKTCPKPDDNGMLGVRYVPYSTVNFEACGRIPVPRMLTWVLKWGLIADLLKKEGEANDPVRAAAAEKLYESGVHLSRLLLGTEV